VSDLMSSPAPVPASNVGAGPVSATATTTEAGRALLEITDLRMFFPITRGTLISRHVGDVRAVDGVTLSIRKGETVGLVGESGCGKSTVGRTIMRLYRPTGGRIVFDGQDITSAEGSTLRGVRRRMQMIFQDPYASLNPRMTAAGIVSEPLEIHGVGKGSERSERVRDLLGTVGLDPDYGDRYPHEFSGGQRQRIGVARALALHPDLIVADEPISALDVSIQAQIINLLERLQGEFGLTYLFIAHDLSVVRHISDRIAVMYLGRLVETATSRELYERPIHPYTVALLSAVPIPDPVVEGRRRRIILTGDVPSPSDPPPGCHFNTRCWLRARLGNPERCVAETPALREMASGHQVACHFAEEVDGSPEQVLQVSGEGSGAATAKAAGSAAPAPPVVPIVPIAPIAPNVPQAPAARHDRG
jgi:oligopeptide transport system ATP-binding protein